MIFFRLTFLATIFVSGTAFAQTREPFQSEPSGPLLRSNVAGSRQQAGLASEGISTGGIQIQPSLTVKVESDSNVLNRATQKRGAVFVVVTPTVNAAGGNEQASYVVRAQAAVARFASITNQNSETFGVEANGRLAVAKKASVFTRVAFDKKIEPRGQAGESITEGSPAEYNQFEAQIAARAETGAMRLTASVTATKRDYADIKLENGRTEDQQFRASNAVTFALKSEYALPNGGILFATGTYSKADSPNAPSCCDQSSKGGQAIAGIRTELTKLISAEISAGYVTRDYISNIYRDFNGPVWQAKVDWYPTPLMSLSIASGRKIVNSGIPTVAGIVVDATSLQLFYEVRRNFDVVLTLARSDENYREIDTKAVATLAGLEGRYIFNNRFTGGVFSRFRDRYSNNRLQLSGGSGFEAGLWLRASL